MSDLIERMIEKIIKDEFNELLNKNQINNDNDYKLFIIKWISLWTNDIDFIIENQKKWCDDFKKVIEVKDKEIREYLVYKILKDKMDKNQIFKSDFLDKISLKIKEESLENNKKININKNIVKIEDYIENDVEEIKINNLFEDIYGIKDIDNQNNKKRKFGEINDKEENKKIKTKKIDTKKNNTNEKNNKKIKKNIKLIINKK